jgi:hypothetical protein
VAEWIDGVFGVGDSAEIASGESGIGVRDTRGATSDRSLAVSQAFWFDFSMPYKIELRYIYGWDDAEWTYEDDAGITPMRFCTVDDAQAELDEFFAAVKAAVVAGNMDTKENPDDYRIVEARE